MYLNTPNSEGSRQGYENYEGDRTSSLHESARHDHSTAATVSHALLK